MRKHLLLGLLLSMWCGLIGTVAAENSQSKEVTFKAIGMDGAPLSIYELNVWNDSGFNIYTTSFGESVTLSIPLTSKSVYYVLSCPLERYVINGRNAFYMDSKGTFNINEVTSVLIDYSKAKKIVPKVECPAGFKYEDLYVEFFLKKSKQIRLSSLTDEDYYILPETYNCRLEGAKGFWTMEKEFVVKDKDKEAVLAFDFSEFATLTVRYPSITNAYYTTTVTSQDGAREILLNSDGKASNFLLPKGAYNYKIEGYIESSANDKIIPVQGKIDNIMEDSSINPFEGYGKISLKSYFDKADFSSVKLFTEQPEANTKPFFTMYGGYGDLAFYASGEYYLVAESTENKMKDEQFVSLSGDTTIIFFRDYQAVAIDYSNLPEIYLLNNLTILTNNKVSYMSVVRGKPFIYLLPGIYGLKAEAVKYFPEEKTFEVKKDNHTLKLFENYYEITLNTDRLLKGLDVGETNVYTSKSEFQEGASSRCYFQGNRFYAPAMDCFLRTRISGAFPNIYCSKELSITGNEVVDCSPDVELTEVTFVVKEGEETLDLPNVQIMIRAVESNEFFTSYTDENGRARAVLPYGKYEYKVVRSNCLPFAGYLLADADKQTVDLSFENYRKVRFWCKGVTDNLELNIYYGNNDENLGLSFYKDERMEYYMPEGKYRYQIHMGWDKKYPPGIFNVSAGSTSFTFDMADYHMVYFNVLFPESKDRYQLKDIELYQVIDGEKLKMSSLFISNGAYAGNFTDGEYAWRYYFMQDTIVGLSELIYFSVKGEELVQEVNHIKETYCRLTVKRENLPDVSALSMFKVAYIRNEERILLKDKEDEYTINERYSFESLEKQSIYLVPRKAYTYEIHWNPSVPDVLLESQKGKIDARKAETAITIDMNKWSCYAIKIKDKKTDAAVKNINGIVRNAEKETVSAFNNSTTVPVITFYYYAKSVGFKVEAMAKGYRNTEAKANTSSKSVTILMDKENICPLFFRVYASVSPEERQPLNGATITLDGYGKANEDTYRGLYYFPDIPLSGNAFSYTVSLKGYMESKGTLIMSSDNFDSSYSGVCTDVILFPEGLTISEHGLNPIRVYPNPTAGYLHVDGPDDEEDWNVQVYATDGSMLINREIKNATLDVSSLNSGIYYIRLFNHNRNFTLKVMRK